MIQVDRKNRGGHRSRLGRTWLADWELGRLVQSHWYMANLVVADPLNFERRYTTHIHSALAVGNRLIRQTYPADRCMELYDHFFGNPDSLDEFYLAAALDLASSEPRRLLQSPGREVALRSSIALGMTTTQCGI
jgi:hypothetical protein